MYCQTASGVDVPTITFGDMARQASIMDPIQRNTLEVGASSEEVMFLSPSFSCALFCECYATQAMELLRSGLLKEACG